MTRTLTTVLLGLALLTAACASPRPRGDAPKLAPPTYAERILARIAAASDREVHDLRYNPGLCGCPPFEILLDGRWTRTTFDVEDDGPPVLVALRAAVEVDEAAGRLGSYVLQGKLIDRVTSCGRGALFVTLDPSAYGAPEPEEILPDDDEDDDDEDEDAETTESS